MTTGWVVVADLLGGLSVVRLGAPGPDVPLAMSGPFLIDVASAILTDAAVLLDGPRLFMLQRFVADHLAYFYGRRSGTLTIRHAAVVAWAQDFRAMIAPLDDVAC